MNLTTLIQEHCTVDTKAMEEEGYDSWVPNEDTVILTVSDIDGTWQRVNYLQMINQNIMYNEDHEQPLVLVM